MWFQISTFCIFLIVSAQGEVDPAPNWQSFAILDYPYSSCVQNDPHACWGLGVCGSNGKCKCNVGWRGPTCAQLDLAPAKKTSFGLPMNGSFPTWGARLEHPLTSRPEVEHCATATRMAGGSFAK